MSEQQTDIDVNARLREFVDAIKASNQYQTYREARERLDGDEDAQQLLKTYQQKQMQLQRGGHDPDLMEELRDLRQQLDDNETISTYMQAEEELVTMLERTNDAISDKIGEEFARSMGGGCC
ncbi:MAG: halo-CC-star protein HcsL [Halapricum sp.]